MHGNLYHSSMRINRINNQKVSRLILLHTFDKIIVKGLRYTMSKSDCPKMIFLYLSVFVIYILIYYEDGVHSIKKL